MSLRIADIVWLGDVVADFHLRRDVYRCAWARRRDLQYPAGVIRVKGHPTIYRQMRKLTC